MAEVDLVRISIIDGIDSRISRITRHILIPTLRLNRVILAEGLGVDVEGSVSLPSMASVKRAREWTRSVNVLLVLKVVRL